MIAVLADRVKYYYPKKTYKEIGKLENLTAKGHLKIYFFPAVAMCRD
jgi:hypothetical protein